MMTKLLELRNVKKYFPVVEGVVLTKVIGTIKAVDNVSFTLNKGETLGIVGESGCGKSTIAKLILFLEKVTSGTLYFQNKDTAGFNATDFKNYRSSVQAVFQDPTSSLNPRIRIRGIVLEPLTNSRLPKVDKQARLKEALERVGLGFEASNRYPHEFSGGQRQRIALARTLVIRPSLIILDEPVSALDVSIQAQIMNLLKELQAELGISYLFIAHNLATVRYMSHQIGVMYLGKLVEYGPSEIVYQKRSHPYTKALFAAALPSHPDIKKEETVLPGEVPSALNPPVGCRFNPRCEYKQDICTQKDPDLIEITKSHFVACHLYVNNR